MEHLLTNKILSPTQYAFRPKSNTVLALQAIINNIKKQKQKRRPTLAIFVDLSKAYDTLDHDILIHKLRHEFNFSAATTTFFRSYLTNRVQETHTSEAKSTREPITHGVPQGSTLSPILFLLYINAINKIMAPFTIHIYADDA